VTDRIIADLEQGVRPWLKPWSTDNAAEGITRPLRHNGTPYRGINVLLLWGEAMAKGYVSAIWMTYRQADELGAHVKKGDQGSMVVYADRFTKTETTDQGEEIEQDIPFMKAYTVFHVGCWDRLHELCNDMPLKQGRHLGSMKRDDRRDATEDELREARGIARMMIEKYLNYIDASASAAR
jgi:antirestriction protein ArdC